MNEPNLLVALLSAVTSVEIRAVKGTSTSFCISMFISTQPLPVTVLPEVTP